MAVFRPSARLDGFRLVAVLLALISGTLLILFALPASSPIALRVPAAALAPPSGRASPAFALATVSAKKLEPRVASTAGQPASTGTSTNTPIASAGRTLADIAALAMRSVATVTSSRTVDGSPGALVQEPAVGNFFGPEREPPKERRERSLGSGVLVSAEGVFLTNNHVVSGATDIQITLPDQRRVGAVVRGTDPETDLAVLEIDSRDLGSLVPLPLGDSDNLRMGDVVLAVGNAFGLGQTVTMGIVSAVGRSGMGIVDYEDFIQTDAAINPGNSGGALVSMEGRLIGINTAILSRSGGYQGIGFAIPSSLFQPVMAALLKDGKVTRGYLGAALQDLDSELRRALSLGNSEGVLVSDVLSDGPGARAGLHRGDVIADIDNTAVHSLPAFRNRIATLGPGRRISIGIVRGGKHQNLLATLGVAPHSDVPPLPPPHQGPPDLGFEMLPLTPKFAARLGVPDAIGGGVVISGVTPDGLASDAGLEVGDLILQISNQTVRNPDEVISKLRNGKGPMALLVWRERRTLYVVLELPGATR